MLRIENLHAEIDGKQILNGLTLSVGAGEVHAIMGPNGAGKSTLGYVLGGRPGYEITEGLVRFLPPRHARLDPASTSSSGAEEGRWTHDRDPSCPVRGTVHPDRQVRGDEDGEWIDLLGISLERSVG